MMEEEAPAAAFDRYVARGPAAWRVRPETPDDAAFLLFLYTAHAPLAESLPAALLAQQWLAQDAAFRASHAHAMRRILLRGDDPVGRIIIDWTGDGPTHGVDIAVRLDRSGRGGGLVMLRGWLAVTQALGRAATLQVAITNPAKMLYERLGFAAEPGKAADAPMVKMMRPSQLEHN